MKSRFENKTDLVEALCEQKIVGADRKFAEALAEKGELVEFKPGQVIIEQGAADRDVYFLLAGKATVIVHGVRLYPRDAGVSIGEMSAINAKIPRSATLEAEETTVVWKTSHDDFAQLCEAHPPAWRRLAVDLAGRLEQRNKFVNRANTKPRIFLISSSEALDIAKRLRVGLKHDAEVCLWNDEARFGSGSYPLEVLEREVSVADFGIALAQPDDLVLSRGINSPTPRDNVIFELGFFMSRLGRNRAMLLVPKSDMKLPSDFKGLTPVVYDVSGDLEKMPTELGPTIDEISLAVKTCGVRSSMIEAA